MAPIDPANTARLYVDYTDRGVKHTVILRPQTGVTVAELATWFNDWLTDNAAIFNTSTQFYGARESAINSDVTNPIAWSVVNGTGTAPSTVDWKPRFGSFVGRSAQGHRTKLSFYGTVYGDVALYRIPASAGPALQAAVDSLNDLQAKLGDITGSKAVWKQYINLGYNAYWQRQARKG